MVFLLFYFIFTNDSIGGPSIYVKAFLTGFAQVFMAAMATIALSQGVLGLNGHQVPSWWGIRVGLPDPG